MPLIPAVRSFIVNAPKVELHLHLVGSASVATVQKLATRHRSTVVPTDEEAIHKYLRFVDFPHFIEVYSTVNALVTKPEDVVDLIDGAAVDLAKQHLRYAEMTITPYDNVMSGIAYPALVDALAEGRRLARIRNVELAWIFDIAGERGIEAAEATTAFATEQPPEGLVGFGLAGAEAGVDRALYAEYFDRARACGLGSVPHAGEGDGPASIWSALGYLRADRIGHGVRALEDKRLLDHLVTHQIPLEVCPTSNVCTNVYPSIASHPIGQLIDTGAFVTINTDDPPMFSTTLTNEYLVVAETFDLGLDDITCLLQNAVKASFMPDTLRADLLAEIAHARSVADAN
jgi:aminodeoxyfutalosine deaminase